jgi:uracil-DNA glycosylase family 4
MYIHRGKQRRKVIVAKKIVRTKSRCKGCPLDGAVTHKVWGMSDTEKPEIILLGEAPGADEDLQGVPFVGLSGKRFKEAVQEVGHLWHKAHKTNVICCRPPGNKIDGDEGREAVQRCVGGLHEELFSLYEKGVKVIIGAGRTAMESLSIEGSLHKVRGSVFMMKWTENGTLQPSLNSEYDMLFIPTFHPAFLGYSGDPRHEVTFLNDLEKAYELIEKQYRPPAEFFSLFPLIGEIEWRAEELIKKEVLLGVDLETSGFVPGHAAVIVNGIAENGETAFSVPLMRQGGKPYFKTVNERRRAITALNDMMKSCPTMFQNALFDARHLMYLGCEPTRIEHDVMILHHCINPELPHNLGYIVSVYGKTPYWKEEMLSSAKAMVYADDETLRTYNLRDSVVLHQVLPNLIADAKESGVYKVYSEIAMPLVRPVLHMIENGILIDQTALKKWRTTLKRKQTTLIKQLTEVANLSEKFNLDSGDHLRYLLFSVIPNSYKRAQKEVKEYEDNPRKKKGCKKHLDAIATVALFDDVTPFNRMKHVPKKTESGSLSVDEEAMLNVQIAATNRLNDIKKLRRMRPSHEVELKECERIIKFVSLYREYKANEKLLTTYTNFPTGADGRLRSPYRITGTNTGRLSSGNKKSGEAGNMQNIPSEAKHIFIAGEGTVFVQFDYSNLELRVLAYISNDEVAIDTFNKGLNVHSENCKLMFQIDESHPLWKAARRACKTYIFGRNYGGGLKGIFTRVMKAVPELNLTYERFCKIDEEYRRAHPAYDRWCQATIKEVSETRRLENAFGRVRYFLGRPNEIIREGLNFPIQSCLMPETKILTKEGWKEIQHFTRGEVWTGEMWAYAAVVTAKGKRTKLYLSDGTTFLCDDNHKLLVENGPWPAWCNVLEIKGRVLIEDRNEEFGVPQGKASQWYWAGRLMGDGYIKKDGSWGIAFNSTTKRSAQKAFIQWLLRQPELSSKDQYRSYKNGYTSEPGKQVSIYAESTRAIWQRWGFKPGIGARNKMVPDIIFTLDRRSRAAFLSGWYDADGTTVKRSQRGGVLFNGRVFSRITSASPEAVQSGIKLAKTVGLNAAAAKEYSKRGLSWGGILFTQKRKPLTVENISVSDTWETTYTLSVQNARHAYSSEGLISKNTAADVINKVMIELFALTESGKIKGRVVGQVHDSLLFELPEAGYNKQAKLIKEVMERPVKVGGRKVVFPVDAEVGPNWKDLKEI